MLETITDISQTSTDPLSTVFTNCCVHPKLFHHHITYLCFLCFDDFSSGLFFFSALFLYVHLSWCCKTRPRGTDQSEGEESSKGCMEGAWSAARTEAWLAGWTLTLLCWLRLRVVPLALTRYLNGSSRFIKPQFSSYRCKDESRK